MWGGVKWVQVARKPEEGGVTGVCELCDLGAGNWTHIFSKSSTNLTADPTAPPVNLNYVSLCKPLFFSSLVKWTRTRNTTWPWLPAEARQTQNQVRNDWEKKSITNTKTEKWKCNF